MLNRIIFFLLLASSVIAKPNIVFIYADDMGWTGTSVEMIKGNSNTKSDFYQTPHLEKLAAQGMVFSQAYSPGPMCTPSRASVLTGKNPAELHITTPGGGRSESSKKLLTPRPERQLPTNVPTIGTLLKANGYATALLGKWHIGRNDAGDHGFTLHDGPTGNEPKSSESDPKEIFSLTERGIRFMKESIKAGKPFYLQLSHYAVHTPTETRPDTRKQFKNTPAGKIHTQADFAGMTWDLDESIDLIFQALEKLNIADNTYLVFMSDNGAAGGRRVPQNAPLNKGKGSLYEGGIRIPLIISGPNLKMGYCEEAVTGTDLLATFCNWADAPLPDGLENATLSPLLTGTKSNFKRQSALFFHYPHYGQGPAQKPQTAIISNPWKLLKDWETDTYKLFNLSSDIGEQNDLSKSNTAKYEEMIALMDQRLKESGAQLPTLNPDYDPSAEPQHDRRASRKRN